MMKLMKSLVYLLEDDGYLASAISASLEELGCKVEILCNAQDLISKKGRAPTLIISDLYVPSGAKPRAQVNRLHLGSGIDALRAARQKWPGSRQVLMTAMPSLDAQGWCQKNGVAYQIKPVTRDSLERHLRLRRLKAFVVHGRNETHRKRAVEALNKAGVDPVVLMAQPSRGQTVIEKFEAVADTCDAAIVVWSADDVGKLANAAMKVRNRARQNVVFELGYFYGALRRLSGRISVHTSLM